MKRDYIFLMFLFAVMAIGATTVFAAAEPANVVNVSANQTNNCTVAIVSSAVFSSEMNVSQAFQYKIVINITNNDTTITPKCIIALTTFKNVTGDLGNKTTVIVQQNGTILNLISNGTDANDRMRINFTTNRFEDNFSRNYNVTFNLSTGLTIQTNSTQRYIAQRLVTIRNVAEIDIANLFSDVIYYYDWTPSTLVSYECTSDVNCNNTVGNNSGKREIAGTTNFINDTTNFLVRFKDSNSTKAGASNYSLEGFYDGAVDPDTIYPEDAQTGGGGQVVTTQTGGGTQYQSITTPAGQQEFLTSTVFFLPNWIWILIIVIIVLAWVISKAM